MEINQIMIFCLVIITLTTIIQTVDSNNRNDINDIQERWQKNRMEKMQNLNFESVVESTWGRLYIESLPGHSGIQYFSAHYGTTPPSDYVKFILADPLTYCNDEEADKHIEEKYNDDNIIVVAMRGNCTFVEKSQRAHDSGARGLVLVNNEEGNLHPSSHPEEENGIDISVTMISIHHGQRIIHALNKNKYIYGRFVPMKCINSYGNEYSNNYCKPLSVEEEAYVERIHKNKMYGKISFRATRNLTNEADDYKQHYIDYKQAQFGHRIENNETFIVLDRSKYYHEKDFCTPLETNRLQGKVDFTNTALITYRGGCNFATKAENIALIGGSMMIVINDEREEIAMGVESDYIASTLQLSAIMISKRAGKVLSEFVENKTLNNETLTVVLHPYSK